MSTENQQPEPVETEQPAQQQEPVAIDRLYIEALIEGLYQNEDPVSIDAAEEFERLLKTPASPPASKPLTDEQIDNTTRKQVDDLLDHIYEYGMAAEGINFRVRGIARAIEAAHGIKENT